MNEPTANGNEARVKANRPALEEVLAERVSAISRRYAAGDQTGALGRLGRYPAIRQDVSRAKREVGTDSLYVGR